MSGADSVVRKETLYITVWVAGLSLLMELVFVLLKQWTPSVLWGNLAGGGVSILNYALLAASVEKVVNRSVETGSTEEVTAKIRAGKSLRMLMVVAVCVACIALFRVNVYATVIPLLFTRIALLFRPAIDKKTAKQSEKEGGDLLE